MISAADVLARALARVRAGWCRGMYAQNERNEEISEFAPDAVAFCALGAIRRAAFDAWDAENGAGLLRAPSVRETSGQLHVREEAVRVLCEALGFAAIDTESEIAEWNDARWRKASEIVEAFVWACGIAKGGA